MPYPESIEKKIMRHVEHAPGAEIEVSKFRDDLYEVIATSYSKRYFIQRLKKLGIKAKPKLYHNEAAITWVYRDIKVKK